MGNNIFSALKNRIPLRKMFFSTSIHPRTKVLGFLEVSNNLLWIFFFLVTLAIGWILFEAKLEPAGDIVEYYGITESLKNHQGVNLTDQDQTILKRILHPAYFGDPGYYIEGRGGERFPVHFIFYSILVLPIRLLLEFLHIDPLKSLPLTNLVIFTFVNFLILYKFLKSSFHKSIFLLTTYLSPLVWFIAWPGPDTYYTSLLLLSAFFLFQKSTPEVEPRFHLPGENIFVASVLIAFASWHSQPLLFLSLAILFYSFASRRLQGPTLMQSITLTILTIAVITIPYVYNLVAFETFTPWTIFQDGWTQLYGFGIQNASFQKLFEQFFDLNIGLFWYAPILLVTSILFILKHRTKETLFLFIALIATAFAYQTNPGWHYGTSGFGPTRHILFIVPFLLYFFIENVHKNIKHAVVLSLFILTQLLILSFNGYITPNFMNSLSHSPYARYMLNTHPNLYNPTVEIFVDRTNHTDITFPTSAVYKNQGTCKKAYVLKTEKEFLLKECGSIPEKFEREFDNEFLRIASFERSVITTKATFWPNPETCGNPFLISQESPFICVRTFENAQKYIGVSDFSRIKPLDNLDGVWVLEEGLPIKVTVPPGYTIHHQSMEGVYVNY